MKKVFVVYNPVSGLRKMRNLRPVIEKRLIKLGCEYEVYETQKENNDFSGMLMSDYDVILAVGGDGTVADVADYVVKHDIKASLGIVGTGSTNLLALSLKIPVVNSSAAVDFAVNNEGKAMDVGLANGRVFLIAAGNGYDNVFMTGATREMKRKIGFLAYVWSFFTTYLAHPKCKYQIEIDGYSHEVEAKTVLVFNFLRLSEKKLGPGFKPDDGVFEVVAMNPTSLWSLIRIGLFLLLRKEKHTHPKITFFEARSSVKIHSDADRGYQIDGDVLDDTGDLDITVMKRRLNVVYCSTSSK